MTCAVEVNQIVIQILENVTNAVRMKTVRTAKRQFVKEKNAKKIQISGDLKTVRGAPLGRGRRISLAIGKRRQFSAFARQKQFTSTRSQHTRYNYNKYTIRSIVCEASCHPVTQSFSHLIIQSFGHSVTWSLGHLVTWSLGHLVTWLLGH